MRRRLLALAAAAALGVSGLLVSAAPAQAAHSCIPESPCYPHICGDIKPKPYVYFC